MILCLWATTSLALEKAPTPFDKSYVTLEFTRNIPLGKSQERYASGGTQPLLGYRHKVNEAWLMGFGGQFKSFHKKSARGNGESLQPLGLLSLYHESLFIFRAYHPNYVLWGPKILYLIPSEGAKFPIVRDNQEEVEIGGGLSMTFVHLLTNKAFLSLRVDAWRGSKTTRLEGLEIACGASWYL